jgi:hypothetical protein
VEMGARRGGRRVEAERKREGGAWVQRGAARWRVVGAAAARPRRARASRCRAIVEDGEVGATRSTWLTGGPGRDGARLSAAGCGTVRRSARR